jgi:hypothetical protein
LHLATDEERLRLFMSGRFNHERSHIVVTQVMTVRLHKISHQR